MKKALRGLGYFFLFLIALTGALAIYIAITGIPRYAPGNVNLKVQTSEAKAERGRKLASMLCVGCHLDPSTGKLTGKRLADLPTVFGTAFSKNITRDTAYGIGSWTDGELAYLLRTGITRTGRYAPPWMPKYPHMSDEDVESVIAFLRSDDPVTVPAAVNPPGISKPSFLTKLLTHVTFKPLPYCGPRFWPLLNVWFPERSESAILKAGAPDVTESTFSPGMLSWFAKSVPWSYLEVPMLYR